MRILTIEAAELRAGDRVLAGRVLWVSRFANPTDLVTVGIEPDEGDVVHHRYQQTQRLRIRRPYDDEL